MKVLLCTPYTKYSPIRRLPMGIGYISSVLRKNDHQVRLYDRFLKGHQLRSRKAMDSDMKEYISGFKPDMIGFFTMSPVIHDTVECVEFLRDFYNGIIIAGGYHASALPYLTLKNIPGMDYIAVGEAEHTVLSLAEGVRPDKIEGLVYRVDSDKKVSGAHIKDLDSLGFPDYRLYDMDHYTAQNSATFKGFYIRSSNVLSSRGCNNRCKFCSESISFGKKMRYHSPGYVVDNIKKLVTDYKVRGIYFHDNNFLASRRHAEDICRLIIKNGLNRKIIWSIQAGTPTVDSDILKLLKEAGCAKIEFGIESNNPRFLKSINKNAAPEANERALKLCSKNNIKAHAFLMTGFRDEAVSDLNQMLEWIKKHKPHTFSLHLIQVHPGTRLYHESGFDFFEKKSWTRENIEDYYQTDWFSSINKKDRNRWVRQVYRPFGKWYYRKTLLKTNTPINILRLAYSKLRSS